VSYFGIDIEALTLPPGNRSCGVEEEDLIEALWKIEDVIRDMPGDPGRTADLPERVCLVVAALKGRRR
jgi:hypothetical protein